jgi:Leucine-rich repeat (LRR) protein
VVTVRDGEEVQVYYAFQFESAPRLTIKEINQCWWKVKPYQPPDFEFVKQDAGFFKILNNHGERDQGSWAVITWRAEGIRVSETPLSSKSLRDQLFTRITNLGGKASPDSHLADAPVLSIDLHNTRTTDADLAMLQGLSKLTNLNLYGTKITDAGLSHIGELRALEILNLNETSTTDSGLPALQRFIRLRELSLARTRVTDAGLPSLAGLVELRQLTLNGTQITDAGLVHLKKLRNLRHLYLLRTSITPAGAAEMQRVIHDLKVYR